MAVIVGTNNSETLTGTNDDDLIEAFDGDDSLVGLDGDDELSAWRGNDTLRGGNGDDNLIGYIGNDLLDGGAGEDEADYSFTDAGVVVNLADGTAQDGNGGVDTLLNIERVRGSEFGDNITGNAANNTVHGNKGNDTINGGDGDDRVDYIRDSFGGGTKGVVVDLQLGTAIDGFGNKDTLISIERARGTEKADTLRGDGGDNFFQGRGGNDLIEGRSGNDYLRGHAGNDTLNGGSGEDRVEYDEDAERGGNFGVRVDLQLGTATDGFGNTDTLISIERVRGTYTNDTLRGNAGDNELDGEGGNDSLEGRDGDDFFNGGFGSDSIYGGNGRDTAAYDYNEDNDGSQGINVNLATTFATDTFGNSERLFSIEGVVGSNFDDLIVGSDAGVFLRGNGGDDTLIGGSGDDNFQPGEGNDSITGGDGFDELSYENDDTGGNGIDVTFTSEGNGTVADWAGDTDTFTGIEKIRGTNSDDTLRGDDGYQRLQGEGGNDFITGGDGDDDLEGGDGNDTLIGGGGNDYLNGGDGDDVINASTGDADTNFWGDFVQAGRGNNTILGHAGVWADGDGIDISYEDIDDTGGMTILVGEDGEGTAVSKTGGVVNDTFTYAHYFIGTNGNDTFTRTGNEDRWFEFRGLAGNDTITGDVDGIDSVDYRRDAEAGGTRGVVVNLSTGIAKDGFNNTDTLISVEEVRATDKADSLTGNDSNNYLEGNGGNDMLKGGNGDDYLRGGRGADSINGGADWDTLAYNDGDATRGIVVTTANGSGTVTDSFLGVDTFTGIEAMQGSAFADRFTGGDGAQQFYADGGNDRMTGGAGDDYFQGGAGNDSIDGGADFDFMSYFWDRPASGIVVTYTSATNATVSDGLGGTDTLKSIDGIEGTNFDDSMTGSAGEQYFKGLGGDDTIDGGAGLTDWVGYRVGNPQKGGFQGVTVNFATGVFTDTHGDSDTLTNIENVDGSALNDRITGVNGTSHRFQGWEGNDTLNGDDGDDWLGGGEGDDSINGNFGNDTLDGYLGNDVLVGGAGNDQFFDGMGIDAISGGEDNDQVTLYVGGEGQVQTGGAVDGGNGTDSVTLDMNWYDAFAVSLTVNLATASGSILASDSNVADYDLSGIENFTLVGDFNTSVTGSNLDNTITTAKGADTVSGGDGADRISTSGSADVVSGGIGNDTIFGGGGADTLTGGSGVDLIYGGGGTGADDFVFVAVSDSGLGAANRDKVYQFGAGIDDIDLRLIDANTGDVGDTAFKFSGTTAKAFSVWAMDVGADLVIRGDVDGDKVADFEIQLVGVASVTAGDFLF